MSVCLLCQYSQCYRYVRVSVMSVLTVLYVCPCVCYVSTHSAICMSVCLLCQYSQSYI